MSLNANISPGTIALSGNPVKLEIISSHPVTYVVKYAGNSVFEGSGERGQFHVFIDETLATLITPTRYTGQETGDILQTSGNLIQYSVEVSNTAGNRLVLEHSILIGGISKRAMRHLNQIGSNIFTFKLLNAAGNFFMTTRSEGRILPIRETELRPLLFLAPISKITIKATENLFKEITGLTVQKCYALNIRAIREYFYRTANSVVSKFDIIVNETLAVSIVLTPSQPAKERYFLEFLNSYGAYECIEVTGKPTLDQETGEEDTYGKYDEQVNDYVESRERVSTLDSLHVQTGFKTEQELMFLLDMLSSDEIYLLDYEDKEIKVNASPESLSFAKTMNQPQSLPILLKFTDREQHFTQPLSVDDNNPRIHTDEFSKEFN